MAGPLNNYFYGERVRRYGQLLGLLLSELQISTEGKTIRVPLEYMGGLRNQDSVTYSTDTIPKQTLKFTGFEVNTEKQQNRNLTEVYGSAISRMKIPVFLDFEWCIRVKKQDTMFQIQEQALCMFWPTYDIKITADDSGTAMEALVENLKIYLTSYDFVDSFEGTGEEPNYYDLTFNIRIEGGYFYGRNLADSGGVNIIKEVDIYLSTGATETSPEQRWSTYYEPVEVTTRFHANLPLTNEEGAYVEDADTDFIVIGSGDWIRPGYE